MVATLIAGHASRGNIVVQPATMVHAIESARRLAELMERSWVMEKVAAWQWGIGQGKRDTLADPAATEAFVRRVNRVAAGHATFLPVDTKDHVLEEHPSMHQLLVSIIRDLVYRSTPSGSE
jgi:hypothetical protein